MKLSIAILTKNEAKRIVACIESAQFADEVIVVDSGSTDDTVALASGAGAKVFNHPDWQGFAVQRNRALSHVTGDYVFFLDADEVITPELQVSIQSTVSGGLNVVGETRWLTVAYGKPIHYVSQGALARLFPVKQLLRYEGAVHEAPILVNTHLPRVSLEGKLIHYSRETIKGSLEKLTQYAMLGAAKRAQKGKRGGVLRGLASGLTIFFRLYFLRLGFLSGGPAFIFCLFIGLECFFRYVAVEYDKNELSTNIQR